MPVVGWNDHDKWMPGISLHNRTLPMRKFEFAITPMYSIANNRVVGFATARINARKTTIGVNFKRFTYLEYSLGIPSYEISQTELSYTQINPFIERKFNGIRDAFGWKGSIRAEGFANFLHDYVRLEGVDQPVNNFNNILGGRFTGNIQKEFLGGKVGLTPTFDALYSESARRGYYSARFKVDSEYTYFKRKKKKVYVDAFYAFTGEFSPIKQYSGENQGRLQIGLGGTTGMNDYLFSGLFLGRYSESNEILSNQITSDQGGVLIPSAGWNQINRLANFLSLSAEVDIPIKLPLSLFMGAGYSADFKKNQLKEDVIFSGGVGIPIVRDYFQIYIPLFYSEGIQRNIDNSGIGFKNTIMFELNIDLMNPFNLLRNI